MSSSPLPHHAGNRAAHGPRRPVHHLHGEDTFGWGIVGASSIAAQFIIPAIRDQIPLPVSGARFPMTSSWVAGIFSHNERRGQAFAETHKIPHFHLNLADMLRRTDIHCVYIGCHPRHHAAFISAALAAGKHVLCESPLALRLDEAVALAQTAARHERLLAVNLPHRGSPALLAAREMLFEGEIGELLGGRVSNTTFLRPAQQTWRLRTNGGGVLFDRTVYAFDALRFLLRDDIAAVDSVRNLTIFGAEAEYPVEEDVLTRITLRRTGLIIPTHDSFIVPHQPTSIELYGANGTITVRHCFDHAQVDELYLRRRDSETRIRLPLRDPFAEAVDRFQRAIRGNTRPQATAADGLAVLAAVLAAHESLRRGYRVDLPDRPRFITDTSYF